mmetsp:Transcript_44373/g.128269  ORF Transcript_44373/g.128269 Transcript_44373/m.128269 type:complete len:237 (+) Transcript_44373:123-833(+)
MRKRPLDLRHSGNARFKDLCNAGDKASILCSRVGGVHGSMAGTLRGDNFVVGQRSGNQGNGATACASLTCRRGGATEHGESSSSSPSSPPSHSCKLSIVISLGPSLGPNREMMSSKSVVLAWPLLPDPVRYMGSSCPGKLSKVVPACHRPRLEPVQEAPPRDPAKQVETESMLSWVGNCVGSELCLAVRRLLLNFEAAPSSHFFRKIASGLSSGARDTDCAGNNNGISAAERWAPR